MKERSRVKSLFSINVNCSFFQQVQMDPASTVQRLTHVISTSIVYFHVFFFIFFFFFVLRFRNRLTPITTVHKLYKSDIYIKKKKRLKGNVLYFFLFFVFCIFFSRNETIKQRKIEASESVPLANVQKSGRSESVRSNSST